MPEWKADIAEACTRIVDKAWPATLNAGTLGLPLEMPKMDRHS